MVRANGSYPLCPGFDSLHRHHPLLKRFRKDLKGGPLADGRRVLLAVSGGGDSVGMLALFLSARPRPDLRLGLAHVHHNLRGADADADLEAVRDLAAALDLPFAPARLKGKPHGGESVEAWAREGRYAALERIREEGGWDFTATAHSLDDQAETVLLRIARGTGLEGLAGILPLRGRVVRPVLAFTGEELRAAAGACGLRYLEDATNQDRRFLRNRVRLDVLPVLESALPGFARKLADMARVAGRTGRAQPQEVAVFEDGSLYYECARLGALSEGEGLEAIRAGLREVRGGLGRIGERHLLALWALVSAARGARVALPGGWEGVREARGIRLRRCPDRRR